MFMLKQIFVFILLSPFIGYSQVGFDTYSLLGIGYIRIPNNMEEQSGKYKTLAQKLTNESGMYYAISGDKIIFQQKGLNELKKDGFSSYVRIIIETEIGSVGSFEKLSTKITASQKELNQLNQEYREQFIQSFKGTPLKMIGWDGLSIVRIGGYSALKIAYRRRLNEQPPVVVNIYQFQNNDRRYNITLSYRECDENIWKTVLNETINSFEITNIR